MVDKSGSCESCSVYRTQDIHVFYLSSVGRADSQLVVMVNGSYVASRRPAVVQRTAMCAFGVGPALRRRVAYTRTIHVAWWSVLPRTAAAWWYRLSDCLSHTGFWRQRLVRPCASQPRTFVTRAFESFLASAVLWTYRIWSGRRRRRVQAVDFVRLHTA